MAYPRTWVKIEWNLAACSQEIMNNIQIMAIITSVSFILIYVEKHVYVTEMHNFIALF